MQSADATEQAGGSDPRSVEPAGLIVDERPTGPPVTFELLKRFRAAAKIDFITVAPGFNIEPTAATRKGLRERFDGAVEIPRKPKYSDSDAWLTVHDPTRKDLQVLIDEMPFAEVLRLEVSVDFLLKAPTDELRRTEANLALYLWLRHSVAPQKHSGMRKLWRKQALERIDADSGEVKARYPILRRLAPLDSHTTFLWEAADGTLQTRLYIKRHNGAGKVELPQPHTRLEATIRTFGGAQYANVMTVGQLVAFVPRIRTFLAPMMSIGRGLKKPVGGVRLDHIADPGRRAREAAKAVTDDAARAVQWGSSGAAYGLRMGIGVTPDSAANRVVERALKGLADRLAGLHLPKEVADSEEWIRQTTALALALPGFVPVTYRGNAPQPKSKHPAGSPTPTAGGVPKKKASAMKMSLPGTRLVSSSTELVVVVPATSTVIPD